MRSYAIRPTGGIALAFLFFSLHLNPTTHGKTFREHVAIFDFAGLFLIVAGVVCLLLGFNQSESSCTYCVLKCTSMMLFGGRPSSSDVFNAILWEASLERRNGDNIEGVET